MEDPPQGRHAGPQCWRDGGGLSEVSCGLRVEGQRSRGSCSLGFVVMC